MANVGCALGLVLFLCKFALLQGYEECPDHQHVCERGHCCGASHCCVYYYELWWFWMLWFLVALIIGCCFYYQKRYLRNGGLLRLWGPRQSRSSRSRRQSRRRSRTASPTVPEFAPPVFDPDKMLRLPSYEEVSSQPWDPPPYDILYNDTSLPQTSFSEQTPEGATAAAPRRGGGRHLVDMSYVDDSPTAGLLENEVTSSCSSDPPPYVDATRDAGETRISSNHGNQSGSPADSSTPQGASGGDAVIAVDEHQGAVARR